MKLRPAAVKGLFFLVVCLATALPGWLIPSDALAEFHRTKIAVLDFEENGDSFETKGMGAIVTEWFTTGLVKSGRFDVVERALLQKTLAQLKMAGTVAAMSDEHRGAAIGKIIGVEAVAMGALSKNRRAVEVNARVISVESGEIIAAESYRSNSEDELHSMVEELTAGIIRNLPLTGYVVKRSADSVVIDLGLDAGLTPGTEFIVYREGEVIRHPKTGEVLDVEQIRTGRLRITRISKNVAEGEILGEERGGIQDGHLVRSVIRGKKPAKTAKKATP